MVSVAGANNVIPLITEYNNIQTAITTAQGAVSAGALINYMHLDGTVSGQEASMEAHIPLSAADSASVLNGLIAIWQNNLTTVSNQISAIT